MMIANLLRPSQEYRLVYTLDPALDDIPAEQMSLYEEHRDISIIEPYFKDLKQQPTIFTCRPLGPEYDDYTQIPTPDKMKRIFAGHVSAISGVTGENFEPESPGKLVLKYSFVEQLQLSVVEEIASVIIRKAKIGDTTPFSWGGIWAENRRRRKFARLVKEEHADTGTVKNDTTK